MSTVKVFLSSSEELNDEKLEISNLIEKLNKALLVRDVHFELIEWERLSPSNESYSRQYEYLCKLKECDICLILYGSELNSCDKVEFDIAFNEYQSGRNPLDLHIHFKSNVTPTPELATFKSSFASSYGNFFSSFENIDTMLLNILLQLEGAKGILFEQFVMVEDQMITVENESFVNFNNVSFAALNKRYLNLRDKRDQLDSEVKKLKADYSLTGALDEAIYLSVKISEYAQRNTAFEQYQLYLLKIARKASRLSSEKVSERCTKAIKLFQSGDASGANVVLDSGRLKADLKRSVSDYDHQTLSAEEACKRIELVYNDWRLKIDTIFANHNKPIEECVNDVDSAYKSLMACAKKLRYDEIDKVKYADLVMEYALFSHIYCRFNKAKSLFLEFVSLCKGLDGCDQIYIARGCNFLGNIDAELRNSAGALKYYLDSLAIMSLVYGEEHTDVAACYYNIGMMYLLQNDCTNAIVAYAKSVAITKKISGENNISIAICYKDIGSANHMEGNHSEALKYYNLSLSVMEKISGCEQDIAAIYNNIGVLYQDQSDYTKALNSYLKGGEILQSSVGMIHPDIAISYCNAGNVCIDNNEPELAKSYIKIALSIQRIVLGEEHPDTKKTASFLESIANS